MLNKYYIGDQEIKIGDFLCIEEHPYKVVDNLSNGLSIQDNESYPLDKNQFVHECKCYQGTNVIALKYLTLDSAFICNGDKYPEYHI